jgi:hypothetical protein
LRAGDVFLCSQRTAYLHSLNLGATPTTIVYFKISHLDHAVLKNTSLESLWVEYKAAAYYVESANEEAAEATQRVIEERASRQRALQQKVEQQQQKVRFSLLVNVRNGCLWAFVLVYVVYVENGRVQCSGRGGRADPRPRGG